MLLERRILQNISRFLLSFYYMVLYSWLTGNTSPGNAIHYRTIYRSILRLPAHDRQRSPLWRSYCRHRPSQGIYVKKQLTETYSLSAAMYYVSRSTKMLQRPLHRPSHLSRRVKAMPSSTMSCDCEFLVLLFPICSMVLMHIFKQCLCMYSFSLCVCVCRN